MLRALAHPVLLLGMLAGFLLAVAASAAAQSLVGRRLGSNGAVAYAAPRRRWGNPRRGGGSTPALRRLTQVLDPYGALAALLSGPGWGVVRHPGRGRRGNQVAALLAGPAAALLVAAVAGAGFLLTGGSRALLGVSGPIGLLSGILVPQQPLPQLLLGAAAEAASVGVLALVPLPPLTGWRVLLLFAGPSHGWQRARYYLEELNLGLVALLVLLILPIGLGGPLLLELVDAVVTLLFQLVG